ncbi:hypothetical protein P5W99_37855 [Paraburkholderia sp. A3BS-1L]|uniref:hypothetical protein n=1 Tax=Paraburkholderia sp. A3BS-1L TaxID=3028375 RepID=UPI003DA8F6E4
MNLDVELIDVKEVGPCKVMEREGAVIKARGFRGPTGTRVEMGAQFKVLDRARRRDLSTSGIFI